MKELIESRQIRAFVAVARRSSFTQGAKDVFLTQSAVSHAIKSLENELGCHLFQRIGRRAVLTPAGERLLQHCEEILHKMQDARTEVTQLPDAGGQSLRIGAPMTVCQHILPAVLRRVQEKFPQCGFRVETGDNPQLLAQLLAGRIDLAVMVEPTRQPDLVYEPLFRDELRLVVPPKHAWATNAEISDEELQGATLIVPNKATRTYQLISNYLRMHREPLARCIEVGSVEAIKELVKNGLGVGVVAEWPIRGELERRELVSRPLGEHLLVRQWYGVHPRHRTPTPAEESVVAFFREDSASFSVAPAPVAPTRSRSARPGFSASRPALAAAR